MTSKRIHISTLLGCMIFASAIISTLANDQKFLDKKKDGGTALNSDHKDDIYIDDESIEGSGGRGEIHEDLEKEADYSGSGFGPDDEDSTTDKISKIYKAPTNHNSNNQGRTHDEDIETSGDYDYDTDDEDEELIIKHDNDDNDDLITRIIKPNVNTNVDSEFHFTDRDIIHPESDDDLIKAHSPVQPTAVLTDSAVDSHDTSGEEKIAPPATENTLEEDMDEEDTKATVVIPTDDEDLTSIEKQDKSRTITSVSGSGSSTESEELDTSKTSHGGDTRKTYNPDGSGVSVIMNTKSEDRSTSFFAQPGILAAVIGGAVVGLLCAILVVMFIVYRMRKKDEGSYALDEPKRSPAANSYAKNANNREFYA